MVGREDVASAAPGSFVEKVKGFSGAVSDGFRMAGNQAASAFNRYGSRKAITESRYTETTIGGVAVGAGPFKSIGGFIQKKTTPESRKAALKAELEFRGSYQSDHLTPQMNEINRSFNRNAARMLNPGGVSTAPPANPLDGKPWQLRTEFCLRYRSLGDFIVKRGVRKEK
jgi:hypothetical protein